MMSGKNRVGQIIEACVAVVTLIALTSGFRIIKAALDDVLRRTRWTGDAIWPTQLAHRLITLDVIDQVCDIDLHRWTPVRDRRMGWHQYIPSSHSTTLESNMSVWDFCGYASCCTTSGQAKTRRHLRCQPHR